MSRLVPKSTRLVASCSSRGIWREISITLRRKSSPDLSRLGAKLVYGGDGDLIAELTKGSGQHLGALFRFSRTYFVALLDESHPFMQDLPNDATESMGHGPDGGLIAEARHQTPEHNLKMTAFLGDRSVRGLVQHSTQVFMPFAQRLLWFCSALSSSPGQVPTQAVNSAAEENVLACAPTSAMICCAESTPKPGTSASRITAS